MKRFACLLSVFAVAGATAFAQFCPTSTGTVLTYEVKTIQPQEETTKHFYTVDSTAIVEGKNVVYITISEDKTGKLQTEPDMNIKATYTTDEEPTVITEMDPETMRAMMVKAVNEELASAGQSISQSDMEELEKAIRPTGKLELVLNPVAAEGSKIPNSTLRLSMGQMLNISASISNGKNLGMETIMVPAGTFECFKISYIGKQSTGTEQVKRYVTAWYAKGIGLVKDENRDKKGELVESSELIKVD